MGHFGHLKFKRKLLKGLREYKEAFNLSCCDQTNSFIELLQIKSVPEESLFFTFDVHVS